MKRLIPTLLLALGAGAAMAQCPCANSARDAKPRACARQTKGSDKMVQVNNADYYRDGQFDSQKAAEAYFALMRRFGLQVPEAFVKDKGFFWAIDFKRGNFAACGMGGVIYVNEKAESYFVHDIFLLPGQAIAEHRHVATDKPAKMESWLVRCGSVYGFSEVGEPNLDQFPEAKAMLSKEHLDHLKSLHVEKWTADGRAHKLPKIETWHFMMGGPEGAIVTEAATYHDGNGLRFANPGVAF